MKRKIRVLVGAVVGVSLICAAYAVHWWRRQHSVEKALFTAPVVVNPVVAKIRLMPVAIGVEHPTDLQFVPGGGTRAVIVEQAGHARLVDLGPALKGGAPADAHAGAPVLDLWVRSVAEMGLLGIAFHPRYAERGTLYVYYDPWVHKALGSRIAEFKLPADELGKHPAVESRVLLDVEQQMSVHQGGQVAFGPDGMLYVGFGDGGAANDSFNNAQNLGSLHGKILRLDVDGTSMIPRDNPFVKQAGARPEVWAYGLRNPWRFSFEDAGRAVVGDVGQEGREEVDLVTRGANLGWKMREGRGCSQTVPHCTTTGLTDPIHDYDRTVGQSVTGGYVATGSRVPGIKGKYLFADFVRGRIWAMSLPKEAPLPGQPTPAAEVDLLGEWPMLISTFGRDAAGDLYVADEATGVVSALMPLQ